MKGGTRSEIFNVIEFNNIKKFKKKNPTGQSARANRYQSGVPHEDVSVKTHLLTNQPLLLLP